MSGLRLIASDRKDSHIIGNSRMYDVIVYMELDPTCFLNDVKYKRFTDMLPPPSLSSSSLDDWIWLETDATSVIDGTSSEKTVSESMREPMPREVWQCCDAIFENQCERGSAR